MEPNHINIFQIFRGCILKPLLSVSGSDSLLCQSKFPELLYYTTKISQAWFWEKKQKKKSQKQTKNPQIWMKESKAKAGKA